MKPLCILFLLVALLPAEITREQEKELRAKVIDIEERAQASEKQADDAEIAMVDALQQSELAKGDAAKLQNDLNHMRAWGIAQQARADKYETGYRRVVWPFCALAAIAAVLAVMRSPLMKVYLPISEFAVPLLTCVLTFGLVLGIIDKYAFHK